MKEFFKSFFEVSRERIKNPLIGSFTFAWVIFNWKPIIYFIFSNDLIENKINLISKSYESLKSALLYPILFALFYIIILPYIMWGLEELYTRAKNERLENKLNLDLQLIRNRQLTTKEHIVLENIKAEYRETLELNDKIEFLESEVSNKQKLIQDLELQLEIISTINTGDFSDRTDDKGKIIFRNSVLSDKDFEEFKKSESYNDFKIIVDDSIINKGNFSIDLLEKSKINQLSKRGLISVLNDKSSNKYNFTAKGRKIFFKILELEMRNN